MPTNDELKMLQALPLEIKIAKTKLRIREWVNYWGAENCYVSFSGGKDSTVLLDIVRQEYPQIEAVFVDTGLEYPEIKKFVRSYDNVVKLRPNMNFRDVILTYGYPIISKEVSEKVHSARVKPNSYAASRFDPNSEYNKRYPGNRFNICKWKWLLDTDFPISNQCCAVMKKKPVKQYEKQTGKVAILGMLAKESLMRKEGWLKTGCNAFESNRPMSNPLAFWTEQDILRYIFEKKLPIAKPYGEVKIDNKGKYYTTGVSRTGCVYCGFGVHREAEPNRYQQLYKTHPKLWEYCMKPVEDGGLGFQYVMDTIGVKTKPDENLFDIAKENDNG